MSSAGARWRPPARGPSGLSRSRGDGHRPARRCDTGSFCRGGAPVGPELIAPPRILTATSEGDAERLGLGAAALRPLRLEPDRALWADPRRPAGAHLRLFG